ncbi:small ribosomal subunit protein eS10B-like [Anopheles bellator]|uniref:small ribosomal subunit protein eS10B-like n=1 Tax=Anopheles bellator TaxID=139047 RepID=UPI002648396B|nr:small ribosomal subunit protein eS10B-like [Anopheles bellator]
MFMPKPHRIAIYRKLFSDGVMVTKKSAKQHPELDGIPNLHLIKTMQSLKSKGLVKEQFVWGHYYWYLNNEGIEYLRGYLHLEAEALPETVIPGRSHAPPCAVRRQEPCAANNVRKDRAEYRRQQNVEHPKKQEKECVVAETTEIEFDSA